jgi:hypothetical protein
MTELHILEEQPKYQSGPDEKPARGARVWRFLRRLALIVIAGFVGALVYALTIGPFSVAGLSNGLFVIGAILFVVALIPVISEIFGRATIAFDKEDKGLGEVLEDQKQRSQQNEKVVYLFALAGLVMVLLSFLLAFI